MSAVHHQCNSVLKRLPLQMLCIRMLGVVKCRPMREYATSFSNLTKARLPETSVGVFRPQELHFLVTDTQSLLGACCFLVKSY